MEKEEISLAAQFLTAMKDALDMLEDALKKKDAEKLISAKSEIMYLQQRLKELI